MVVKVVKLTEKLWTLSVITFQNSQGSVCAGIFVFINLELPRVWTQQGILIARNWHAR